jgi:hypothetical protein
LEQSERERDRLRRENVRLRDQLEAARRAGFRQAAPFVIPAEFVGLYLTANAIAFAVLALATWMPRVARWVIVAVFVWASVTNTRTVLATPAVYLEYAALMPVALYRDFITGWFSTHIPLLVLPIAAGQLLLAALLTMARPWRVAGVLGALVFLLAIAPLGVGSGFPFSLTFGAAVVIMDRRLGLVAETRKLGWAVLER